MNEFILDSSNWYHAINLRERIMSLGSAQHSALNGEVDINLAKKRMQRWQSQSPFSTNSYFNKRLAMDNITEDEFLHVLGEPIGAVRTRFSVPPVWLNEIIQVFSCSPSSFNLIPMPKLFLKDKRSKFLNIIEPLISQACNSLCDNIQVLFRRQSDLPFSLDTVEETLMPNILTSLSWMLGRTLVLELNVARLQKRLNGDTPEQRFNSFLKRIRQRDTALAILQEYPVLIRQLKTSIDNWVSFMQEFLDHLCADWFAIRKTLSPDVDPGMLVELKGGIGDTHRGGRSVLIAKFASGFQVVYKPKSLSIDVHFQKLLRWVNERGGHPPFRTLKVLNRGKYGWVEFANSHECTTVEEIQRFYERQGGYLALLYTLEATDFHSENLIAAGEHPILIDLESLFHPRLSNIDTTQSDMLANDILGNSVLRIGLLPQRIWLKADYEGIDLSGLGGEAGQFLPGRSPHVKEVGTDEMHYSRKQMEMPAALNRPKLNNSEVSVLDYSEAIITGFTKIYRLLMKHRNELLSNQGPLSDFAGDEIRTIIRPTRTYGLLLYESFHPDLLRDALDRDCFFDKLWVGVKDRPDFIKVIPAEHEDLQRNDIPMFTTRVDSHDLWTSSGEVITDFFNESGMSLVHGRLQLLCEQDLTRQLWFIRASLATLSRSRDRIQKLTYRLRESKDIADREHLLKAACDVGDRLEELAFRTENDASWLGLTILHEDLWSIAPLGIDIYSGVSGVAIFLAYLGAVTGEERYTVLAQEAFATMKRQKSQSKSNVKSIGGFGGWGSFIYTLTHLGALWHKPDIIAMAEEVVEFLPDLIEQDGILDIIGGSAGCIGGLISLYNCAPTERTLAVAIQCGEHLLNKAQPMEQGIGWFSEATDAMPLAGFSHGAAGIAWALMELSTLTGEKRFREVALSAINYERGLFDPEQGNWRDLRDLKPTRKASHKEEKQKEYMIAWCHGAPGIGLARLCALRHLDDTEIRTEINTALKTTLAQGFGRNHSLCHGDLGNLELLLQASKTFNDSHLHSKVYCLAAMILESIEQNGWLCGVPLRVETPGLMVGITGIGYELLRLAYPKRVPSILILEPPYQSPNSNK